MGRGQKRVPPPQLNRIPPEDLERMERDGLGRLYTPTPEEAEKLRKVFGRAWSLFYDDFVKDEKPVVTAFFTWDGDTSAGDFAPPNDGICCCWEDRAGIGIEKEALSCDVDYIAFLLLHEVSHLRELESGGNGEHDADFENQLEYLLSVYNDVYGTHLMNDFSGYKGEYGMKVDQQRADSAPVPDSWAKLFARANGGSEKSRSTKKRKVAVSGDSSQKGKVAVSGDSSQRSRRDMIRRMQQADKEPAAVKKSKVRKSYNGVSRE